MRILAIDDEKLQLDALYDCIRENNREAEILKFQSSSEAYDYAISNDFDVIFVDIEMPRLNGIEFAKKIKKEKPNSNIIFVTAYSEYAMDAFSIRASGYVQKPVTAEKIKAELLDLRHPMEKIEICDKLKVTCFGPFEVTYKGKPFEFSRSKTLELLAFLIDRRGARSSTDEIVKVIFNNDKESEKNNKSYLRHLISDLSNSLKENDLNDVFLKGINSYSINTSNVQCDLYDYLEGAPYAVKAYRGEYMSRYHWAQKTKKKLL